MNVKEELQKSVNVYTEKLKKKLAVDIDKTICQLHSAFGLSEPELRKCLLESFVDKFEADIDQCDTQSLLHFVIKFSELLNMLKSHRLKDFSPLTVNGYVFTPNGGIPSSIDVERTDSKTPLGKIVIHFDMITVRTSNPEVNYHVGNEFIKDDVVMSILGNFINKLNTRSYTT